MKKFDIWMLIILEILWIFSSVTYMLVVIFDGTETGEANAFRGFCVVSFILALHYLRIANKTGGNK